MEIILDEDFSNAVERLKDNPHQTEEILDLLLQSIRKGTLFQILNVENRIHEIANSNPYFSQDYIWKYVELFKDNWFILTEPPSVHYFLPDNIGPIIPVVGEIDHSRTPERMIKVQFFRAMILKCNSNCKNLCDMQQIAERLGLIADETPFVMNPFDRSDLNNFDVLVDKSLKLIENIEEDFAGFQINYSQICENLKRYPVLKNYIEIFLYDCIQNQRYSPLLKLLAINNDINDAYLSELEKGIPLFESLPNEKHTTPIRIRSEIKNQLEKNENLEDFISEILIMNKLGRGRIIVKDKKIGKKYIDLEMKLGEKEVLLEIKAPNMQRDATICGSGFLKNKFDTAIVDKRRQLKQGLSSDINPLIDTNNLFYYVVIDGSKTPIAQGYMDLFIQENQQNDLVSGVIVFRPRIIDAHHIALYGWIKNNPKARNMLSLEEKKELRDILFE